MYNSDNVLIFSKTELSEASLKELLPDFFEEIQEDYVLLTSAYNEFDFKKLKMVAHKITGTAASYNAILISKKARLLQEFIDRNEMGELDKMVTELGESIEVSFLYSVENFKMEANTRS